MLQRLRSRLRGAPEPESKTTPRFVDESSIPLLANAIFDWQIVNGMMLKYRDRNSIKAKPVSVSLVPTAFPRHLFEHALSLQKAYNELYAKVSCDEEWLFDVLKKAAEEDDFVRALMEIYTTVKEEGFIQDLTLGIFRSDYMLHQEFYPGESFEFSIKQVEINTISVAGACHATNTASMHAYLAKTGAFHPYDPTISPSSLPTNSATTSLVFALSAAHIAYGPPKSPLATETAILIIVQPFNYNIADERPIEHALWNLSPAIPMYRCILLSEIISHTTLTPTRELLYQPPSRAGLPPMEISVAYSRAGGHPHELVNNPPGILARVQIERSRAIKCPSILGQLAGTKIVQMALALPGVLERFISDEEERRCVAQSFGKMYPLDGSERGGLGRAMAMDPKTVKRCVLKPCRDGGGNNVYGGAIPEFLRGLPREKWKAWILMEMFNSPAQQGRLMTQNGVYEGEVVSELGIVGSCLWRADGNVDLNDGAGGWTFKTKPVGVEEMSVVKGYGCFDCPRLVDGLEV